MIFSLAAINFAQTRTITNKDLETYKEQRLKAEKEYRENYERLGFPSPQELDAQIEQSNRERSELAARLRAEKLQREQYNAIQSQANALAAQSYYQQPPSYGANNQSYYYGITPYTNFSLGYFNYNRRNYPNRYNNRRYNWRNNQMPPIRQIKPIRTPNWIRGNR